MDDVVSDEGIAGFRLGGVAAGIKVRGGLDLGLIASERPASAAGVFTRNRVKAAPVLVARERVRRGTARAILVNAGNANACTGPAGLLAVDRTTKLAARALGCEPSEVLPASTGVIGKPLAVAPFARAMPGLAASLVEAGTSAFARAIMTTDRWPKVARAEVRVRGGRVRILAIAKGAGMIHPDMATTLAFVLTDGEVRAPLLARILREACDETFNAISVDGDTSTNDAILALASGAGAPVTIGSADSRAFARGLTEVLGELGRSIVRDGEGAEHCVRIEVRGLASDAAARKIARTVATSPLVKTALHGRDANWGRLLAAAGRAGVAFDPSVASVKIGGVAVMRGGRPLPASDAAATAAMKAAEYTIELALGDGAGSAHYLTSDLGHAYVDVNASYRS